ncbi:MAG: glycosyltransferase family 4 protein [Bacteroidota bacterium]
MKKIAHYAPNLWAKGGIATYVRRLGEAQTAAGMDVVYFSRDPAHAEGRNDTEIVADDAALFARCKALSCDILHLHKPVYLLPEDRVTTVRTMHGNQGSCPTGTRFLARSSQPCKRHYSVAGCFMTHLTERCGSLKVAKIKRNFGGIKNEFRLGAAVHTFTVSHFLKDWMVRTGFDESMLHVLNSPAPDRPAPTQDIPNSDKPRFAFLGRLVPQKGVPWLLRALKLVKSDIHVDIAGDGPLHAELEAYCKRNDLQDIVTFHGWVDQQQVRQIMADARGIVFPSVWEEPAGLITLEAAAAGRPVIASKAGGIPEYALDEFSLLVSPNNDQQLAEAIDRLAGDHDLAVRMGACGLRNAKDRYSMSRCFASQKNDVVTLFHLVCVARMLKNS